MKKANLYSFSLLHKLKLELNSMSVFDKRLFRKKMFHNEIVLRTLTLWTTNFLNPSGHTCLVAVAEP